MDRTLWESPDSTVQFELSSAGTERYKADPDSLLSRRLQHYRRWCLEHQATHRYLQIFTENETGSSPVTYSRPIVIEPKTPETVLVTMHPRSAHPHPSLQFSIVNRIVDNISEGLLVAETESIGGGSNIVFLNQTFANLYGYEATELIGWPLERVYRDVKEQDSFQQLVDAWCAFSDCSVELTQRRQDGTYCVAGVSQSVLADDTGWFTHVVSTHRDITQEVSDRALKNRSRELGLRMQEMAKTGWWRLNIKTREFECDDGVRAICEVAELPASTADLLKFVVVTDQSRIVDLIDTCVSTGRQAATELRIVTGQQNNKWLRIHLAPEDAKSGEVRTVLGTIIDITDVIQSERLRHDQHDELQFYLNCLDAYSMVVKLDSEFRVTFANELFCDSFGFSRSEVYRRNIDDLAPEDMKLQRDFYKTIQSGQTWRGEWLQQTKSGAYLTLDVHASPRLDINGNVEEVFTFLYDISARRLSDAVSQAVATVRVEPLDEGLLQRGLERLVSVSRSQSGSLQLGDLELHANLKDDPDYIEVLEVPVALTEAVTGSIYLRGRPGGYSKEINNLLQPLIDSVLECERNRRAEIARQHQVFENQYILETMRIGSWRRNLADDRWYFSDELFEMLEFPSSNDGLVPESFWEQRVPRSERKKLRQTMHEMLKQDGNCEVVVCANLADNRPIYIKVQGRLTQAESATTAQIVGIASDVTAEVRTQRELENQKSLASHQARLASIGELAAGVGHEINNPLTIIRGFLDITRNELMSGELSEASMLDLIDKMDESAMRIGKIVEGLRSLSHTDPVGQVSFQPENLLRNTVGFVEEIYRREGIQIEMRVKVPEGVRLQGHEGKLQQVVMNLLSNARDATEGQTERKIIARLSYIADRLLLSVEDNGPGVSAAIQQRIFDPFFTTKEIGKGTGIGLSMVFGIVQEFDGSIVYKTGSMGGAEFVVRLLLPEALPVESPSTDTFSESQQSELVGRVLVVDDEAGVREFLMLMLGQMGLVVDTASNGKQALEVYYAAKKPYDLVISDLTMPIMGGLELLDQIKAKNQQLDAPRPARVLLSTGLPDFVVDTDRYPMVIGLLNKPFNLALLRKKLLAAGLAGVSVSDQERKQKTR